MYYGNFNVNNGTRLMNSIEETNLKRLLKRLKDIASGEIFFLNKGEIKVCDEEGRVLVECNAIWQKGRVMWYSRWR